MVRWHRRRGRWGRRRDGRSRQCEDKRTNGKARGGGGVRVERNNKVGMRGWWTGEAQGGGRLMVKASASKRKQMWE